MSQALESAYAKVGMKWIETYQGHKFDPTADEPHFDVKDIAHALSLACRWGGQCSEFMSVAEHSVMVSKIMEYEGLGDPMVGLWHDGTEAYMSDVPAPFKQLLPDWSAIDLDLEAKLYKWLDLPFPREAGCKTADWLSLFIEARDLMPTRGNGYLDPEGLVNLADDLYNEGFKAQCWTPKVAEAHFLDRYEELQKQTGTD